MESVTSFLNLALLKTDTFILNNIKVNVNLQSKRSNSNPVCIRSKKKCIKSSVSQAEEDPKLLYLDSEKIRTSYEDTEKDPNQISILWENFENIGPNPSLESIENLISDCEKETFQFILRCSLSNKNTLQAIEKNHFLIYSAWQKLHTGHWKDVPLGLRLLFTWFGVTLVNLLLKGLLNQIDEHSSTNISEQCINIIQACDRSLLMGVPLEGNPLCEVASILNSIAVGHTMCAVKNEVDIPQIDAAHVPKEAAIFPNITPIENKYLPSLQDFIVNYFELSRPVKIKGLASQWPALRKWNFEYFRKIAGFRTVPVEIGNRYSDDDWSQTLMFLDKYIKSYCISNPSSGAEDAKAYLAQHQLFDQIPELLNDIWTPDYCHTGLNDPVLNAWIGPNGTVTPLHFDPDHNILVQVFGYKAVVIFPESDSSNLYAFSDPLLENTSQVNLDDLSSKANPFEDWPLLKNTRGHYLVLGPGDGLYLPPKWWHFVKSLSGSMSVSFWWR